MRHGYNMDGSHSEKLEFFLHEKFVCRGECSRHPDVTDDMADVYALEAAVMTRAERLERALADPYRESAELIAPDEATELLARARELDQAPALDSMSALARIVHRGRRRIAADRRATRERPVGGCPHEPPCLNAARCLTAPPVADWPPTGGWLRRYRAELGPAAEGPLSTEEVHSLVDRSSIGPFLPRNRPETPPETPPEHEGPEAELGLAEPYSTAWGPASRALVPLPPSDDRWLPTMPATQLEFAGRHRRRACASCRWGWRRLTGRQHWSCRAARDRDKIIYLESKRIDAELHAERESDWRHENDTDAE